MFKSSGWCVLADRKTAISGSPREMRRVSLQTPMTPAVLSASFDEEAASMSVQTEKKEGVKFNLFSSEPDAKENRTSRKIRAYNRVPRRKALLEF